MMKSAYHFQSTINFTLYLLMLLQLEILLRVVSVCTIIVVPLVWLIRYVLRRYRSKNSIDHTDDLLTEEDSSTL